MNPCIPRTEKEIERYGHLTKLMDLFDGKNIIDIDGKEIKGNDVLEKYYGLSESSFGNEMFSEIVYRSTYKPYSSYESFTDGDLRRIKNEILKEAERLDNPKLSYLERFGFVRRGVMRKHAVSNWANKQITGIANYERVKYSSFLIRNRNISRYLRQETIDRGQSWLRPGIKGLGKIDRLEKHLFELYNEIAYGKEKRHDTSLLEVKATTLRNKLQKAFTEDGGAVLKELSDYLITSPSKVDGIVYKDEIIDGVITGNKVPYSINVQKAGEISRDMLNEMGGVLINGLRIHKDVITQSFMFKEKLGSSDILTAVGKRVRKYHKRIDEQIEGIAKGIEVGNYFPHYLMEGMVRIENLVGEVEARNLEKGKNKEDGKWSESDANSYLESLESIFSEVRENIGRSPQRALEKSKEAYDNWLQNPLAVLRKYGYDAIAFNKNQGLKNVYLRAQKHMGKMEGESLEAMRKYVRDVFTMAEKGYGDRPAWVNKTIRTITAAEFIGKIGLGVGTAARNMFSGMYYLQGVGNRKFAGYLKDWYDPDNAVLRSEIEKLEKEQGFVFRDLAPELYTEGLVSTQGVKISDIDMKIDPESGKPRLSYKEGNIWRAFDSGLSAVANWSAFFQRVTENILRKHMFRSAYMIKRQELDMLRVDVSEAKILSKTFALDMVNKYAFEYAAHQKAPIAGGDPGALGGAGQVAFQFMHYPMSFLQQQSEILRNSKSAIEARQFNNPDVIIPIRFGALYLFTQLLSGVMNKDLNRIMENDVVDRIKNIYDVFNGKEDVKGRGYIGPAVGDLMFYATLYDLIKLPDNEFADLIFGYNDANKLTDEQKTSRIWATLNVEASKWITKHIPEMVSGKSSGFLMHEFGVYPRKWTKDLHKRIFGKYSQVRSTRKKSTGKSKYKPPSYAAPRNVSGYSKKSVSPSKYTRYKRPSALQALNKIQEDGPVNKYSEFDKKNLLTAIDMIDKQRTEEEEIYTPENNRKMIMT